ncbi:mRNA decay activator protein ZFP36 [Amia ocellicauda]|uniref:mRNA decay activator protein ZFP36 n=1 Tax=Amia ocellicauda TaxID=2972642 RepID=UPI0034641601
MSERFNQEALMNLINLSFDDAYNQPQIQPHRNRSSVALSQERVNEQAWSCESSPWSTAAPSRNVHAFRSDRSMSLTESSSAGFGKTKPGEVPPPPGFPPLNPSPTLTSRYKTELCRSFEESGSCKYGNKCQFAHGEAELRGVNRHPKYKTEACRTFYNFGYCPYGSRCHFIHEDKVSSTGALPQPHSAGQPSQRQFHKSVSFAGFLGPRSSPPPSLHDPLGFTRAPSVSPPPAELLSPVFSEAGAQQKNNAFLFCQSRASLGDIHSIPHIMEPSKPSCCVCGHGGRFPSALSKSTGKEAQSNSYHPPANLQRFSSEDSLSDRDSYSSGSLSGCESPTFDSIGSKRLTVFARMSLSD